MLAGGGQQDCAGKTHEMGDKTVRRRSCRLGEESSEELWGRKKVRQTGRRQAGVELEEMKQVFQPSQPERGHSLSLR